MTGRAEAVAIAVLLILLSVNHCRASPWLRTVERALGRMARRQGLSIALIGLLALTGSAMLALFGRMPYPQVHDEFSYLLAADTFAHGRLANPTHPLWAHFESLHVIHQPTYASKYPPGQGLLLAAGQVIAGLPQLGLWISTGLAAAAVCWMLFVWLPPWWAVLGSLLAALHPGFLISWSQSYMGGSVAMIGGALVFGSVRRIMHRPRASHAALLGVGLAVLANSRPYEGLIASLPVAGMLCVWMFGKNGPSFAVSIKRVVLPTGVVLMLAGVAMGYYNMRVTGDAFRMPYLAYDATYANAPFFLWLPARPLPAYRHEIIRYHHVAALEHYLEQQSISGLARASAEKIKSLRIFYLGSRGLRMVLIIPLLMLPWLLRDRWPRFALLTCGVMFVGLAVETWVMPHYAAPVAGLVCVILLQAMRHLYVWHWRGRQTGRFLVWAIAAVALTSFITTFAQQMWVEPHGWGNGRARLIAQLKEDGMRHLVIVRYGPRYSIKYKWAYWEWVYNEADIDDAQVVWAREMNGDQNRKLLEYFNDRKVWLLELHEHDSPPKLVPYPVESPPMTAS
jgi:hypothetical protein